MFLGATKAKANSTTAEVAESFYIKTKTDPHKIKLRFNLKDKDHMEDDAIGHVSACKVIETPDLSYNYNRVQFLSVLRFD